MTCVNKIYLLCYFENNIQIYLVDYTNVFGSLFKPRKNDIFLILLSLEVCVHICRSEEKHCRSVFP